MPVEASMQLAVVKDLKPGDRFTFHSPIRLPGEPVMEVRNVVPSFDFPSKLNIKIVDPRNGIRWVDAGRFRHIWVAS